MSDSCVPMYALRRRLSRWREVDSKYRTTRPEYLLGSSAESMGAGIEEKCAFEGKNRLLRHP
jgi:hypothetical protein